MIRDKNFVRSIVLMSAILLVGTLAVFFVSIACAVVMLVVCVLLITIYAAVTKKRYREISALSAYLEAICRGDNALDIPDYREGELSILKTNIYKTAVKLRSQKDMLAKDKTYLSESLADISHQLKTPITSMTVIVDLLKDEDLDDEKRREFLNTVDKQLSKTNWIVQNLLKLSKIDSGQIEFKKEPVNLTKLADCAVKNISIIAELKNQTLLVSGDTKASFTGDFNWTAEAVTNIVKNCCEHTPEGGKVEIDIQQTPIYATMKISDNGCGISKKDIHHIFERFYKGENSSSESVGIGLALAKSIFARQRATIEVFSIVGKGTTFTIKFYKSIV